MVGITHTLASYFNKSGNVINRSAHFCKVILILSVVGANTETSSAKTQMIYMNYIAREDVDIIVDDIYPDLAPDNTYFAVITWWGGYCGIQYLPNNISRFIFAQWQPQKRDGYVTAFSLAAGGVLVRADEGKANDDFQSNALSYRNDLQIFPIKQWHRFVVRSWDDEFHKNFSQLGVWTQDPSGKWTHQATFVITGRRIPLLSPGSFVEDFLRDGKTRRGLFRPQLVHYASEGWEQLSPVPGILTVPQGDVDNRYNASSVKGGVSLQIGQRTETSKIGQALTVISDASINTSERVIIRDMYIKRDVTQSNNFNVGWAIQSSVPQFKFKIGLFSDEGCQGSEISHAEGYDSELRNVTLSDHGVKSVKFYAKYEISDIYGNVSTECVSNR